METTGAVASQVIAGYRLVRVLARGRNSDVWLAVSRNLELNEGVADAAATPVAIKLFHPSTPVSRIDVEVEALGRASHRHLQQLIDLAIDPLGQACVVLSRLGPSLARVIENRRDLSAGEAVTILAPLCLAVVELHRVGVAHGRIDAGSILFDPAGAPVLTSFGDATLVGEFPHPPRPSSLTPAEAAAAPAIISDRKQLAALAELVLQRTTGDSSALTWLRQLSPQSVDFALELADRLFSSASAVPVAIRSAPDTPAADIALEIRRGMCAAAGGESVGGGAVETATDQPEQREGVLTSVIAAVHVPPWLDSWVNSWVAEWSARLHVGALGERTRAALAPVRKRVWIAAALGALALLFAVVVLSLGALPANEEDASVAASHGSEPPGALVDETSAAEGVTREEAAPALLAAVTGDDPLAAATALLALRESCIQDRSVLCLDAVDQADSAAMDNDRHLVRQLQQGPRTITEIDWSAAEIVLIDELGDGALFDLVLPGATTTGTSATEGTQPASLLLIRTDDGWRIRDLTQW